MPDDVDIDPEEVEAAAGKLRQTARDVDEHGSRLDTRTSRRVGHGALGQAVDDLVKRGVGALAHGVTSAVKRLHEDTADGLERAAKRSRKSDHDTSGSLDSLGNDPHHVSSGSILTTHDAGPSGSGSKVTPPPKEIPERKPAYAVTSDKWKAKGGTIEYHEDGSVTYTTGKDHAAGPGHSVTYDKHDNPDFSAYLTHPSGVTAVDFGKKYKGNYNDDFKKANELAAGIAETNGKSDQWTTTGGVSPPGYTWHHHQNLTTIQLVERPIHQEFKHRGGVSMLGGRK